MTQKTHQAPYLSLVGLALLLSFGVVKAESRANPPDEEITPNIIAQGFETLPTPRKLRPFLLHDTKNQVLSSSPLIHNTNIRQTILVFWADWCPPCVQELKTLDKFLENNKEKLAAKETQILTIALRTRGDSLIPVFFKRHNLRHLTGYWNDDPDIMTRLGIEGLPATLVLTNTGDITHETKAPIDWSNEGLLDFQAIFR